MTTVYLAGPMRGHDHFNFPAFDAAARHIAAALGWTVPSPADRDRDNGFDETAGTLDGFDLDAAMAHDLTWIIGADGIVLLPGWRESTGARIERLVAETCGKRVWEYHEDHVPPVIEDDRRFMAAWAT